MSTDQPTSTEAADALRRGQTLDTAVRHESGWFCPYLFAYAVATVALALVVGLVSSPVGVAVGVSAWVAITGGLSAWSRRKSVTPAGFSRRHGWLIGAWAVLWAAVVIPGSIWFHGNPAWWVPGALVTALPALVIYVRERHPA